MEKLSNETVEGPSEELLPQLDANESLFSRAANWVERKKTALTVGSFAAASALVITNGNYAELKDQAVEAAPWVASGIVASEGAFIAGAAIMAASVGDKVGNPLKIKEKIPVIAQKANESKIFKAGFWTNAAGAVGTAAVISAGVATELPAESYPLLTIPVVDIAITIKIRSMLRQGIRKNATVDQLALEQNQQ